ncbi:MAG: hypothetical protein HC904_00060 [Blastochloris sp.]|nr:hypothetical protein [Blastochloris sp.]
MKAKALIDQNRLALELKRIEEAYIKFIRAISRVNENLPVIAHGYDYVIPSSVGPSIAGFKIMGPWLKPVMEARGIRDAALQREIARILIDEFNDMLASLQRDCPKFYHLNLRGTLEDGDWNDEIHPNRKGFEKLAIETDKFIKNVLAK